MRWPWVSRRAYDEVAEERLALRAQNAVLLDQILRIKRAEMGMRETPRAPSLPQAQRPEYPPAEVRRLYAGRFHSHAMEQGYEQQAMDMHVAGAPWDQVRQALVEMLGEPPAESVN